MNANTNTTEHELDLFNASIDALAEAGFVPTDADEWLLEELELNARDRSILGYYAGKGYDVARLEATTATAWALLVRWGERSGAYELMAIDRNGVTLSEARFGYNAMGLAWLAATLEAADADEARS